MERRSFLSQTAPGMIAAGAALGATLCAPAIAAQPQIRWRMASSKLSSERSGARMQE